MSLNGLPITKKLFLLVLIIMLATSIVFVSVANLYGAVINLNVRVNPLTVKISAPSTVKLNDKFNITATVSDIGGQGIDNVTATLTLPDGLAFTGNSTATQKLGSFSPRNNKPIISKNISWSVKAVKTGNCIVTVQAKGQDVPTGANLTANQTTAIQVVQPTKLASLYQGLVDLYTSVKNFIIGN